MAMNQFLAEYYGTAQASAPAQDDTEKTAQVKLFVKMASEQGIDLNTLSDEQVEQLYADTFSKTAEEEEGEAGEEGTEADETTQSAEAEFAEKKEAAAQFAQADYAGRVMAHAYTQEMRKIAASTAMVHVPGGGGSGSKGHDKGQLFDRKSDAKKPSGSVTGQRVRAAVGGVASKVTKHVGAHKGKYLGGLAAAGGLAAGAAAAKAHDKKASAIDELAAPLAVEKAAAAGWNSDQASQRISAVMLLGPSEEGSKVASAANLEQAVDIRASELLELAGYPVNWS